MESYQTITLVIGIAFIVIGLVVAMFGFWFGVVIATVSFIGIIASLVELKHHKAVGISLIVLGIVGNLLLIIPGIMAYRYKPEGKKEIK